MSPNAQKELKLYTQAATEFARKLLLPNNAAADCYPFGDFFDDVLEKAFELDFFHLLVPESYGGLGQNISALCAVLDALCQEDSSLGAILFTNGVAQEIMISAGAYDIYQKMVGDTSNPLNQILSFPTFRNPSEVPPKIKAQMTGNTFLLSGTCEYLVMGGKTRWGLIPAVMDDQDGYSFFMVLLEDERVTRSEPILSLGVHACPAVDLSLNNATGHLIGLKGKGAVYFQGMSDRMLAAAAAMSAGIMKGSFKEAFAYSKKREQGGRKIVDWSEIQMILADMACQIKIAEMVIENACQAIEGKTSGWQACTLAAAVHVQKMACDVTSDGVQILGGVGYMKDFGQEKRMRDAKHLQTLLGLWPVKRLNYFKRMINRRSFHE
jgi:alkylation response protein AidB-like acyl-CoA dehydrogenase